MKFLTPGLRSAMFALYTPDPPLPPGMRPGFSVCSPDTLKPNLRLAGDANHHFIHSITPHSVGPWQRRPGIAPSLRLAFDTGAGAAEAASRSLGAPAALVKGIAPITTSIVRSGPRRVGFVDGTPRRWTGHCGRRQVPPACSR